MKTLKLFFSYFFIFLFSSHLFGQDTIRTNEREPLLILKYSLLSLVDPGYPSIQFAVEYPLSKRISLQNEAGYIKNLFFNDSDELNKRGVRIRNEARYYLRKRNTPLKGFYIGPELLFIYAKFERTPEIDCVGGCQDEERIEYTVRKTVIAPHFKVGYQNGFGRFIFDVYLGGGFRHVTLTNINKPENAREPSGILIKKSGNHNLLSFSLGFKIGFLFLKK